MHGEQQQQRCEQHPWRRAKRATSSWPAAMTPLLSTKRSWQPLVAGTSADCATASWQEVGSPTDSAPASARLLVERAARADTRTSLGPPLAERTGWGGEGKRGRCRARVLGSGASGNAATALPALTAAAGGCALGRDGDGACGRPPTAARQAAPRAARRAAAAPSVRPVAERELSHESACA